MAGNPPDSITDLFYLVANLLSTQEQLSTIPHDMSVSDAVHYMEEMGLSHLPVKTWNTVIGVFSFRSFCRAILEIEDELEANENIGDMSVGDFIEQHRFYSDDDNWESILRYLESDNCVLVGSRENFRGSISPMDAVRFLYKVAKPFVVIAEIELSIRRMISNCVDNGQLQTCIQNSLSQIYTEGELPSEVEDMTFNDYIQVICHGDNWEHFEPFFGRSRGMRKRTRNFLSDVGKLRNDIFHFKRTLTEDDLVFLNNKRELLQNKARMFEGERRRSVADEEVRLQPAVVVGDT